VTRSVPPTSRWQAFRHSVADATGRARQAFAASRTRVWVSVVGAALLLLAAAGTVNAMVTPATRAGNPTSSVMPLPAVSITPTPSASVTPGESASGEPSASAKDPDVKSSGRFTTASLAIPAVSSSGELRSYAVRVETSLKLKADSVGKQVAGVLNDPRSWTGSGDVRFDLVKKAKDADFTITLAASGSAKEICKPEPAGTCVVGSEVVIDAASWQSTPESFSGDSEWQSYLVNHGLGQLLGEAKAKCAKKDKPAPVMMPQSGELDGCLANPWPFP
jgi:hypothetical protein